MRPAGCIRHVSNPWLSFHLIQILGFMILTAPHPHVFAPPAAPQWLLDDSLALPLPEAPARLAQSAERKALNLVVAGSSPTVGAAV